MSRYPDRRATYLVREITIRQSLDRESSFSVRSTQLSIGSQTLSRCDRYRIMETSNLNYQLERAAFSKISELNFYHDCLTSLPESIGSLTDLTKLYLSYNSLSSLPENIGNLINLTSLHLGNNKLTSLPNSIGNLSNLQRLYLYSNELTSLPESIGNLSKLVEIHLDNNQLVSLPKSVSKLSNLTRININGNLLTDLSMLQKLPNLNIVIFANINLPRRYWTKFSEWKPQWLLDERNTEIRRILIERVGYEKICEELEAETIDSWREYVLIKIDIFTSQSFSFQDFMGLNVPETTILLLKMTCPSTAHVHILRVPPEITSAESAITWVNHDIHPDEFHIQT
jgi:leucine-rich repeat protein SHOC2